jgi:hypothetical protein
MARTRQRGAAAGTIPPLPVPPSTAPRPHASSRHWIGLCHASTVALSDRTSRAANSPEKALATVGCPGRRGGRRRWLADLYSLADHCNWISQEAFRRLILTMAQCNSVRRGTTDRGRGSRPRRRFPILLADGPVHAFTTLGGNATGEIRYDLVRGAWCGRPGSHETVRDDVGDARESLLQMDSVGLTVNAIKALFRWPPGADGG